MPLSIHSGQAPCPRFERPQPLPLLPFSSFSSVLSLSLLPSLFISFSPPVEIPWCRPTRHGLHAARSPASLSLHSPPCRQPTQVRPSLRLFFLCISLPYQAVCPPAQTLACRRALRREEGLWCLGTLFLAGGRTPPSLPPVALRCCASPPQS